MRLHPLTPAASGPTAEGAPPLSRATQRAHGLAGARTKTPTRAPASKASLLASVLAWAAGALLAPSVLAQASAAASPPAAGPMGASAAAAAPVLPAPDPAVHIGQTTLDVAGMAVVLSYPTHAPETPLVRGAFRIEVALDAPPLPGRRPLVVISHGARGSAIADQALAARMVRAGLIVAQPQHRGDNFADGTAQGMDALQRRPAEVSEVIDALAAHPLWSAQVDTTRVGLHGMSIGGATALAVAGGQWNMLNLIRHCNRHREADEGFCFQGAADPAARAEREQRFNRARWIPDFVLPASLKTWHGGRTPAAPGADPRTDARIAAVSLAVPVAAIFSADSLARIRVPVGVVGATADQVLLPRFHAEHVLRHVPKAVRLHDAQGGGHFDLLWPWPEATAREVARTQARGGLPTPGFAAAERELAQAHIVAFQLQHLGKPAAR